MEKFYFTFGSDWGYPYQNTYLVVMAESKSEAIEKFRKRYPDRRKNVFNCAFVYNSEQWEESGSQGDYPWEPVKIIV